MSKWLPRVDNLFDLADQYPKLLEHVGRLREESYNQGKVDTYQKLLNGIAHLIRMYELDKENVPKPSALSIYAYVVAMSEGDLK